MLFQRINLQLNSGKFIIVNVSSNLLDYKLERRDVDRGNSRYIYIKLKRFHAEKNTSTCD